MNAIKITLAAAICAAALASTVYMSGAVLGYVNPPAFVRQSQETYGKLAIAVAMVLVCWCFRLWKRAAI